MRATFANPDPNCHPLVRAAADSKRNSRLRRRLRQARQRRRAKGKPMQLSQAQINAAAQIGADTADLEAELAARENPLVTAARKQAIQDECDSPGKWASEELRRQLNLIAGNS